MSPVLLQVSSFCDFFGSSRFQRRLILASTLEDHRDVIHDDIVRTDAEHSSCLSKVLYWTGESQVAGIYTHVMHKEGAAHSLTVIGQGDLSIFR